MPAHTNPGPGWMPGSPKREHLLTGRILSVVCRRQREKSYRLDFQNKGVRWDILVRCQGWGGGENDSSLGQGLGQGMGGGERRGWEGGQGRNEERGKKKNPAVRRVALFMLSPSVYSLHSPAVGRMLRWLKGQITHKIKTNTQQ